MKKTFSHSSYISLASIIGGSWANSCVVTQINAPLRTPYATDIWFASKVWSVRVMWEDLK